MSQSRVASFWGTVHYTCFSDGFARLDRVGYLNSNRRWISWTLEDSERVLLRSGEPLAVSRTGMLASLGLQLVSTC